MFAIAALICFILGLFHVAAGDIDFELLGLAFIALHLILGYWPARGTPPWRS